MRSSCPFLCSGAAVKLVCSETGLALPKMVSHADTIPFTGQRSGCSRYIFKRIRKVEKDFAELNCSENEPVSQLQKCAFQLLGDETTYLCLRADEIVLNKVPYFTFILYSRIIRASRTCHSIIDGTRGGATARDPGDVSLDYCRLCERHFSFLRGSGPCFSAGTPSYQHCLYLPVPKQHRSRPFPSLQM